MLKRIAILVKGKSTFKDGKFTNLDYLDEDIKLMSKTLKDYGQWELSDTIELKNPKNIKDALILYAEYNEIIFYYTGHGRVDSSKSEFNLVGEDPNISLEKIFRDCREELKECTLTIIIDACRSGYYIDEAHKSQLDCEILTATNHGQAYPKVNANISFFTNLFCEFITKKVTEGKPIYLKEIGMSLYKDSKRSFEEEEQRNQDTQKEQPVQYLFSDRLNSKPKSIIANYSDIKTEQPPKEQKLFLTIQLNEIEKDVYTIIIWAKSKDGTYLKNIASQDIPLNKTDIAQYIEDCIEEQYTEITSDNIYLIFVIPSTLMTENINAWILSGGTQLGQRYTVVTRALERFTSEGTNFKRNMYRYVDWVQNWKSCEEKSNKTISNITHSIINDTQALGISSRRAKDTPLIVLNYTVGSNSFISLYKSHISMAMWINGCKDYNKFVELLKTPQVQDKQFGNLLEDFFEFKPNETGLEGNIMLLYDNPNDLPPDEFNKVNAQTPKGEQNGN